MAEIGSPAINFPQGISIPLDSLDRSMKDWLQEHPSFKALCLSNDNPNKKVFARLFYFAYTVASNSPIARRAGIKTEASQLARHYKDAEKRGSTEPFGKDNPAWLLEVLNFWIALKEG